MEESIQSLNFYMQKNSFPAMPRQLYYAVLLLSLAAFMPAAASASAIQPGATVPSFRVYRGKQPVTCPEMLAGKVLVITYETRDVVETNRLFKSRVTAFCTSQENASGAVIPLPVINCSGFFGIVKNYCASKVDENSKKENLLLYADMDGIMFRDFGMIDDASNVFIIDKQGIIRYRNAGRIGREEAGRIIELIKNLAVE